MTLFGSQILEDLEATHLCQGGEDMSRYVKICQDMSRCYCTSLWSERNACRSPRSAGLPGAKAAKVYFMLPVTSLQYHQ